MDMFVCISYRTADVSKLVQINIKVRICFLLGSRELQSQLKEVVKGKGCLTVTLWVNFDADQ